jgi:dTDP-D-glucose 4,6-dehydratase
LYADNTLARKVLGFQPTITLEQGLRQLRQWYLERGESPQRLLESEVVHNWETHRSPAGE